MEALPIARIFKNSLYGILLPKPNSIKTGGVNENTNCVNKYFLLQAVVKVCRNDAASK